MSVKKGDLVTIIDGSYARTVENGELKHEFLNCGGFKGLKYKVVETNCAFPLVASFSFEQPTAYQNDTVIQGIEGVVCGKVVFIHHRFLAPTKHTITFDDKDVVELSHESFVNLKRQLLQ